MALHALFNHDWLNQLLQSDEQRPKNHIDTAVVVHTLDNLSLKQTHVPVFSCCQSRMEISQELGLVAHTFESNASLCVYEVSVL